MPGHSAKGSRLDPEAVRRWLKGHQAAQRVIEQERYHRLRQLDEASALRIYLALKRLPTRGRPPDQPSPVLMAMRQAVARMHGSAPPRMPHEGNA